MSLKFKLWMRRLSISPPKVTIRTSMPWSFRIIAIVIATAAVAGLGWAMAMWAYDFGRNLTGFNIGPADEQLLVLKKEIEKLQAERDRFSTTVNAAESQLNIEKSAQKQLMTQVNALENENNKLKEDLAFFESLLPTDTGPLGISIRRLKADIIAPNQLRYRLLIMQSGKSDREFAGTLQILVTVLQNGKDVMMAFPKGNEHDANKFKLEFKHYQRMEGILALPDGVSVKAIQARIFERGQIRTQQAINL